MRNLYVFLCFLLVVSGASGQFKRHIVEFADKGPTIYSLSDPRRFLSARSIERRMRQSLPVDSTDIPVHQPYIDSIRSIGGIEIIRDSRWLNAVLIRVEDETILQELNRFPFIKRKRPIAPQRIPGKEDPVFNKYSGIFSSFPTRQQVAGIRKIAETHGEINYGFSAPQIEIHEGNFLHDKGFTGSGIIIALLDAGYQGIFTNPALDSLRIQNRLKGGFDFVDNEEEISTQHAHGAYCLSILAANLPGKMVGSAPHASYLLFRTENAAEEYPIEEFFWACAAEQADSIGADMISSSLGYSGFDNPVFNYSYADKNGNIAISTIAADYAAKKGMIVCNSAGNSGTQANDQKYISVPADGDSVLAIGAILPNKTIASFSSWGPRQDGTLKPDLVSIGQGTTLALTDGTIVSGNGTSYSNPNLAGLIACLWQAFPEFTNMEIINAVKRSADRYANPDERYGYGIPNFRMAFKFLEDLRHSRQISNSLNGNWIKATPNPFDGSFNILLHSTTEGQASIRLLNAEGKELQRMEKEVKEGLYYSFRFRGTSLLPAGLYLVEYRDKQKTTVIKVIRQQ